MGTILLTASRKARFTIFFSVYGPKLSYINVYAVAIVCLIIIASRYIYFVWELRKILDRVEITSKGRDKVICDTVLYVLNSIICRCCCFRRLWRFLLWLYWTVYLAIRVYKDRGTDQPVQSALLQSPYFSTIIIAVCCLYSVSIPF